MCRNIRRLHNFVPPAQPSEMRDAALQYVRKIAGVTKPSAANREAFDRAVDEVTAATERLLASLTTTATPRTREEEAQRARERFAKRQARAAT